MTSKLHLKQLFPSEPFSISLSSHHPATGSTAYSYASSRPAAGSPRLAPVSRTRRLPHSPRGARCISSVELQGYPQHQAMACTSTTKQCQHHQAMSWNVKATAMSWNAQATSSNDKEWHAQAPASNGTEPGRRRYGLRRPRALCSRTAMVDSSRHAAGIDLRGLVLADEAH
jgi:hypothetical protein